MSKAIELLKAIKDNATFHHGHIDLCAYCLTGYELEDRIDKILKDETNSQVQQR